MKEKKRIVRKWCTSASLKKIRIYKKKGKRGEEKRRELVKEIVKCCRGLREGGEEYHAGPGTPEGREG